MAALKQSFEQTTPSRRQLGREHPFELDALHHNLHPFSSKACQLTVSTGKLISQPEGGPAAIITALR
jgi:hypothetical protein